MSTTKFRRARRLREPLSIGELPQSENDLVNLDTKIDRLVRSTIDSRLKVYKRILLAFIAGFVMLFTVSKVVTNGDLLELIMKSLYKPDSIYRDIEPNMSIGVWNAVTSGSEDDYKKFISRDEFYTALAEYHTDLVRTFLVPNREPLIRAREIMRVGGVPEDVLILMGGPQIEGNTTSRCFREFKNDEKHAILVIPRSFEKSDYSWFDCAFGWPKILLAINYQQREVEGIELVGVRRNGGTKQLQVIISRNAAEELELPNWETYAANAFGKIRVSNVEPL